MAVQQEDILYGRLCVAGPVVHSGSGTPYVGPYTVTPKTTQLILATNQKTMTNDLTVTQINTYTVANPKGYTMIIGDI